MSDGMISECIIADKILLLFSSAIGWCAVHFTLRPKAFLEEDTEYLLQFGA
jgi:hypothetical protein